MLFADKAKKPLITPKFAIIDFLSIFNLNHGVNSDLSDIFMIPAKPVDLPKRDANFL